MTRDEERKLIRKAKRGDDEAMTAIIRAHQDSLYAFMLRMSGRPDVAEDVVQEAFVRVLKNIDRFDPKYRFSTWLFTIAKRLFMNWSQKLKPSFDSDLVGSWHGPQRRPERSTFETESKNTIQDILNLALLALGETQREIVLLFHQQEWSIAEISSYMEMPEGTVKSHLHRARRRMKAAILDASPKNEQLVQEVFDYAV